MIRGIQRSWFLAGLFAFGVMLVGVGQARASSIGIKGTINPLPGGSPFLYEFDVYLTGGSIATGSTITIGTAPGGLVGVTTQSGTEEPSYTGNPFAPQDYYWVVPTGGIDTTSTGKPAPYDQESSVTWKYLEGPSVTYNGTNIFLGTFTVETAKSFPDNAPPVTPGVTVIDFNYSLVPAGGGPADTGGGSLTLSSIPEPSSVILIVIGAGALPLLLRKHGRSHRMPSASSEAKAN